MKTIQIIVVSVQIDEKIDEKQKREMNEIGNRNRSIKAKAGSLLKFKFYLRASLVEHDWATSLSLSLSSGP